MAAIYDMEQFRNRCLAHALCGLSIACIANQNQELRWFVACAANLTIIDGSQSYPTLRFVRITFVSNE
jgi:hypothetical protein